MIITLGNRSVHAHRDIPRSDAMQAVKELFHFCYWDDQNYPPRQIQGFYKKAELELLIQRRATRRSLQDASISDTIVERFYQTRAIRKIAESFEKDHERKALLVMATGSGKPRTQIGSPGQPIGTCAYCGQGIALCMSIKSADDKRFVVGSDCVEKLYRDSNVETTAMERAYAEDRVYQQIKQAKLKHQRELRHKREAIKIAEGLEFVESHQALLESLPSSVRKGESVWSRYDWFMENAGNKGKLEVIREIRAVIQRQRQPAK